LFLFFVSYETLRNCCYSWWVMKLLGIVVILGELWISSELLLFLVSYETLRNCCYSWWVMKLSGIVVILGELWISSEFGRRRTEISESHFLIVWHFGNCVATKLAFATEQTLRWGVFEAKFEVVSQWEWFSLSIWHSRYWGKSRKTNTPFGWSKVPEKNGY
jgi:cbb3-type cytochrome oxidase subunit 3